MALVFAPMSVQAQFWSDDFEDGDISDWTIVADINELWGLMDDATNPVTPRSGNWVVWNWTNGSTDATSDDGMSTMSRVIPEANGIQGVVINVYWMAGDDGAFENEDWFTIGYRLSNSSPWITREFASQDAWGPGYQLFHVPVEGTPTSTFEIEFGTQVSDLEGAFPQESAWIDDVELWERPVFGVLLTDDFEDGDISDWTLGNIGGDADADPTNDEVMTPVMDPAQAHGGNWMVTNGGAGQNDGEAFMSRVVPIPAGQGARITVWMRQNVPDRFESTDVFAIEYRLGPGLPWLFRWLENDDLKEIIDPADDPGQWEPYFTDVALASDEFEIRFRMGDSANDETWQIDDVKVEAIAGSLGTVSRILPADFTPGATVTAQLSAMPNTGGQMVVTETVSAGLTAANIVASAGTISQSGQDIIWTVDLTLGGPIETLTYDVGTPVADTPSYKFAGTHTAGTAWPDQAIGGNDTIMSNVPTNLPFGPPVVFVNFEDAAGDPTPVGYASDTGTPFGGPKDGGFNYGWIDAADGVTPVDNTGETRNRNDPGSPDERYDSMIHVQRPGVLWEIELPNADYEVFLAGGDPNHSDQAEHILIEGKTIVEMPEGEIPESVWSPATTDGDGAWVEGRGLVTVADGRLTLGPGPNASNMKMMYIEIYQPPPAPSPAPVLQPLQRRARDILELNWSDVDGEWGYRIERKIDTGAFVPVAVLENGTTRFLDPDLATDLTYTYRVVAYNGTGDVTSNEESLELVPELDAKSWQLYR